MFMDYWAKEKFAEERQRETEREALHRWKEMTDACSPSTIGADVSSYESLQRKAMRVLEDMLNNGKPENRLRAAEIILKNMPKAGSGGIC